jgi:VanZ family protein
MGAIFLVSAQPTLPSVPGRWDLLLKKTTHVLAYGVLTLLYVRALRGHERRASQTGDTWIHLVSAAMALLYAVSDEYHQTFVPGRHGTLADVAIDGIGVIGALLLAWWARLRRRPGGEEASG